MTGQAGSFLESVVLKTLLKSKFREKISRECKSWLDGDFYLAQKTTFEANLAIIYTNVVIIIHLEHA